MTRRTRNALQCALAIAALILSGCNIGINGGDTADVSKPSSSDPPAPTAQFTVGGSVAGLNQSGLVLASGSNSAAVASGAGSFTLPNLIAPGMAYSVAVQAQPVGESCSVANGSGTAQANVTNVNVTCSVNTYTIGGPITGLNASGLVLSNGSSTISATIGMSAFVFSSKVPLGATYTVSVQTQPTGLQCQVINGTGTMAAAAVTNVLVTCGQWTWIAGANHIGASGVYGTRGTAAAGNSPGARQGSVSWLDRSGKLWLFGGSSTGGSLNDLWRYDPSTKDWTWISGASTTNGSGVYGTQGVAASSNVPGARALATAWSDSAGNLWLFAGTGYDAAGANGALNDLWKFNIAQGQWTWVSGANSVWAAGSAPPSTAPGARSGAVSWIDAAGNLWLFGGTGTQGLTNDLWQFAPSMGQWTLVSGSQTPNAAGVYGMEGTAASTNVPGSRAQGAAAIDAAGDLWLFGGSGYGSIGGSGSLSDLWKFDPSAGQWTWMGGWKTINAAGTYGTTNTTDPLVPGARSAATAVADGSGNLWLFGGIGYDSAGVRGALNDTWEYDLAKHGWIWISGSQTQAAAGSYGTLGSAAVSNVPGARSASVSWMDTAGDFWIFGGTGLDGSGGSGVLNDLWEFSP